MNNSFKKFSAYSVSKVETLSVKGGGSRVSAIGSQPFSGLNVSCTTCSTQAVSCKDCKEVRCWDHPTRTAMNCG